MSPSGKSRAKKPGGDAALKQAVLEAALGYAASDGFTDKVLRSAGEAAGADGDALARLYPDGPLSLVEAFSGSADAEMTRLLAKAKLPAMKVRERIALAVKTRIAVLRPHKEAARRGEQAECRRCGHAFASLMHVQDLITVEGQLGYRYEMKQSAADHYQWVCPHCRRALFGLAQANLWGAPAPTLRPGGAAVNS